MPLPEGASVRGFAFSGTASEPTAELLPKDAAMTTYKAIVATMKDPAILEFAGYNLIRSSLFPIEPYGTQKIRLTYEHILPADGHRVDYVLPRHRIDRLQGAVGGVDQDQVEGADFHDLLSEP